MRVNAYLTVTGILFGIIALAHALRLINAWPIVVGSWQVSVELSWVGVVIAGGLSIWAIVLLRRRT